jgi:hypothetical protein
VSSLAPAAYFTNLPDPLVGRHVGKQRGEAPAMVVVLCCAGLRPVAIVTTASKAMGPSRRLSSLIRIAFTPLRSLRGHSADKMQVVSLFVAETSSHKSGSSRPRICVTARMVTPSTLILAGNR